MTIQIIRTIPATMAAMILAFSDAILTLTDQKWEYLGQSNINEFQTCNAHNVYFYELHFHADFFNCFTYLLKVILMHSLSCTWHITKKSKTNIAIMVSESGRVCSLCASKLFIESKRVALMFC